MRLSILAVAALATVATASKYYVMGDWGGIPKAPYTTPAELKVAAAMGEGVASHGVDLTVALGDNFYKTGVATITDPRFNTTFEDVFTNPSLQGPEYKFYIVGGNHDHLGNITAQVDYSRTSTRWVFPAEYYTFTKKTSDGATIEFVLIDTIILAGNSNNPDGSERAELPGPTDQDAADKQWQWIETTLAASKADYLVVGGHYPVWSVCGLGSTKLLVDRLRPLLEKYRVTAFLGGHDHCAEYIDEGTGVQYHVIGAAHGCDTSTAHMDDIPAGSLKFLFNGQQSHELGFLNDKIGAFAVIVADSYSFTLRHLDDAGNVMYVAPSVPSRNSASTASAVPVIAV